MNDSTYRLFSETFKTGEDFVETKLCKIVKASFATPQPSGAPALALLVTPPKHRFGSSTVLAWKRQLQVDSDEEVAYGRTLYVTSSRYGVATVQTRNNSLVELLK